MKTLLEDYQWVLIILAIIVGLLLGQVEEIADVASFFIVPFLMIMLFGTFIQIQPESLKQGFKNVKVAVLSLAINFLWTPLLAFGLVFLFLRDTPDVYMAMIMDLVTPCTDWYLVFTGIAAGNVAFSTTLLPWNLLFQLILLPVYLFLFAGAVVDIEPYIFFESFFKVLLTPFVAALIIRRIIIYVKDKSWLESNILDKTDSFQAFFLTLAIVAMFSSQGEVLINNPGILLALLVPVFLFFSINFFLGLGVSRLFKLPYPDAVSLIITTLARNAPLAMTIAIAAFPERPLVPLVLAIESLIELPLLLVIAQLLLLIKRKKLYPYLKSR